MTATIQTDTDTILALVRSFIDHPTKLALEIKEHPGIAYWTMQFHASDHGLAVGKRGAHFDALKLLITEIGHTRDTQYVLRRYKEPEPAARQENIRRGCPEEFDPAPAAELLTRVLEQLSIGQFLVDVKQSQGEHPLAFAFTIVTRSIEDYNTLTIPREDNTLPMTMVGALGTLFRAYGNRNGVRFAIEVTSQP
jgi:predicted RNA-binding protein YlqC (UPF0109 family)